MKKAKRVRRPSDKAIRDALEEFERLKKNRYVSDTMIEKIKLILHRIGEHGPKHNGKLEQSIACGFCDMGEAGYAFRGDGFHDDDCAVKDAQLLYEEMFGKYLEQKENK